MLVCSTSRKLIMALISFSFSWFSLILTLSIALCLFGAQKSIMYSVDVFNKKTGRFWLKKIDLKKTQMIISCFYLFIYFIVNNYHFVVCLTLFFLFWCNVGQYWVACAHVVYAVQLWPILQWILWSFLLGYLHGLLIKSLVNAAAADNFYFLFSLIAYSLHNLLLEFLMPK
jgi:hypothetical protein